MNWVLDSSAILCWLFGEPGVDRVRAVLESGDDVAVHAVNLVEVQYILRRRGQDPGGRATEQLDALGLAVVRDLSDAMIRVAADLKVRQSPIALGDTIAVALAIVRDATLLTTDRAELEKIRDAGLCAIEFPR